MPFEMYNHLLSKIHINVQVWASASRDFEQNSGGLCNMCFFGQPRQWSKTVFLWHSHTRSFSHPRIILSSTVINCHIRFCFVQLNELQWTYKRLQIMNTCMGKIVTHTTWKVKNHSCHLWIFTVVGNNKKLKIGVCILPHLSFAMYDSRGKWVWNQKNDP